MKKIDIKLTALAAFLLLAFTVPTAQAVVLNSSNFPDNNFRAALTQITGVAEGGTFDATAITSLDVTGKGITNLTGIANFTELTELNISDNQIKTISLTSNTKLTTLEMRNNTVIHGFGSNATNKITFPANFGLKKLDAEGCTAFHYISNITTYCTGLEWVSFKNCAIGSLSTGVTAQTNLKYLDYSGNLTTTQSANVSALKKLEILNLSNNGSLRYANVSGLSELREFNMAGNDMYWTDQIGTTYKLTPANCPKLEVLILDNAKIATAPTVDGFQSLKTLSVGGSKNTFTSGSSLVLNNCPAIETVNVSGAANITSIAIKNSGLSELEDIPTITSDGCTKLKTLVLDGNQFSDVPAVSGPFTCLSLQSNNFPAEYSLNGNTLEGLDLGSNGFTSLTVENSAMSALALGGNTALSEVHLHGNANLKKTASATGISDAQGLYIKGLGNLETLDIENSSFEQLGQNYSTQGCSGLKTLKAAHNKFTTFSNAYTSFSASSRTKDESRSSLEHLTGLKYLDLSNNLLQDSLHLFKNTKLETLIVRNNRTLTKYSDNTVVKKKFHTPGDVGEFNDTTGLRMLNLLYNTELKYLDISYTYIQHFARDGRFDKDNDGKRFKEDYYMANFATKATESATIREPHQMLVTNCNKLEEFYADYNGMKSAAFIPNYQGHNFPNLRRISMIETRGQDSYIMKGSWNPNGSDGCPNLEYINVANSDLDSIGVTNNKNLKYLNVSGNWTKSNWSHWRKNVTEPGHTLNLKGCDALVECVADDCPHLVIAQANDKTNLTSLSLNNNPDLKQVYVPNTGLARINGDAYDHPDPNPDTRTQQAVGGLGLAGLNTATNLELLYCEDNSNLTKLDVTANSNLKYLHAYNNKYGADGLDLSGKLNLKSAWVSNSDLTSLQLNGATVLDTLKCQDNAALAALDVHASGAMRYLDLARCHVADLDLSANTALVHFDCSNYDKCDENQGNWLSDLNFTSTALQTVVANNNNLYNITLPESLTALTRMEFAHNHINGIDLSRATNLAPEAIVDVDNGRTITAECAASKKTGKLYYFQLVENAGDAKTGFDTYLASKESVDELKGSVRPGLAQENFQVSRINTWDSGVDGIVNGSKKAMGVSDIDPELIYGKVVVLSPNVEGTDGASGCAEYSYDNGRSTSKFYLKWTAAAGVVTGVDNLNADSQVENVTYYNLAGVASQEPFEGVNLVVKTMTDGSTITTKMTK